MHNPREDGITHINIYSKGKTELGRLLSNFAYTPFTHAVHGSFHSVEGYWYWLKSGKKHDHLRTLSGFLAKRAGKQLESVPLDGFEDEVKEGIRCKLRQNRDILIQLTCSELPFAHYYWYGDESNPKIISLDQYQWIVDEIERIRLVCQEKYRWHLYLK